MNESKHSRGFNIKIIFTHRLPIVTRLYSKVIQIDLKENKGGKQRKKGGNSEKERR